MRAGRVVAIFVAGAAGVDPVAVPSVRAVTGRGLEGDRYFLGTGTYSNWQGSSDGEALTLIEAEALEGLAAERGIELAAGASRRNVLTRGIALNELVGRRFRVGTLECYGVKLCEPCRHLERLTEQGVLRGLVGRGGLNADIFADGEIAVGDTVSEHEGG